MHRPDHSSADPDGISAGKAGYTDGDPGALPPIPPTKVISSHMNDVGENSCVLVEGAGYALEKGDYAQVLQAVKTLACIAPLSQWTAKTAAGGYAGNFRAVGVDGANDIQIVAVGTSGEVQISGDGDTFADEPPGLGYSGQYNDIARVGSTFVACTNDGEIHTRTDVPAWSKDYTTVGSDRFYCSETSGSGSLVGGDNGTTTPRITRDKGTSFDTFSGSSSQRINAAAHNGTSWIAVGQTGASGYEFLALTGSQWAPVASGSGIVSDIAWGKGLFVAVGAAIRTSPNGTTWTTRTSRLGAISGGRIAYLDSVGVFVHVQSSGLMEFSLDGITWHARSIEGVSSPSCLGLAISSKRAITVGASGKIQVSARFPFTV